VWEYSHTKLARAQDERGRAAGQADPGEAAVEEVRDTSEHLRVKLTQWCEAGVSRITKDMEGLETHSAVRNVMRLFDRIKDFEKRVVSRDGELAGANLEALIEALTVLAQTLGPFAPHLAEELWIAFGHEEHGAQTPWPGVSFGVPA
jgi:leucyl-tRNA synthetase